MDQPALKPIQADEAAHTSEHSQFESSVCTIQQVVSCIVG